MAPCCTQSAQQPDLLNHPCMALPLLFCRRNGMPRTLWSHDLGPTFLEQVRNQHGCVALFYFHGCNALKHAAVALPPCCCFVCSACTARSELSSGCFLRLFRSQNMYSSHPFILALEEGEPGQAGALHDLDTVHACLMCRHAVSRCSRSAMTSCHCHAHCRWLGMGHAAVQLQCHGCGPDGGPTQASSAACFTCSCIISPCNWHCQPYDQAAVLCAACWLSKSCSQLL